MKVTEEQFERFLDNLLGFVNNDTDLMEIGDIAGIIADNTGRIADALESIADVLRSIDSKIPNNNKQEEVQ